MNDVHAATIHIILKWPTAAQCSGKQQTPFSRGWHAAAAADGWMANGAATARIAAYALCIP